MSTSCHDDYDAAQLGRVDRHNGLGPEDTIYAHTLLLYPLRLAIPCAAHPEKDVTGMLHKSLGFHACFDDGCWSVSYSHAEKIWFDEGFIALLAAGKILALDHSWELPLSGLHSSYIASR
jgi:hypothetical protein